MGSPEGEKGRYKGEDPQHVVTISKPFAAGKLHVTVDQFAAFGGRRCMKPVRNAGPLKMANSMTVQAAPGAILVLRRRVRTPWSA
jgi:formylglycine-generating enzyme required for sulfatase activity